MWKTIAFSTIALPAGVHAATPYYFQNFPGGSSAGGSISLSSYNWSAYSGSSSVNATLDTPGSAGPNAQVSNGGTAVSTMANTPNATAPPGSSTAHGVPVQVSPSGAALNFLLSTYGTAEGNVSRASGDPADFTWEAGSQSNGDTQQLAIQIGQQWYASTTVFMLQGMVSTASLFATDDQQETVPFNTAAASWEYLNFAPGIPLTLGGTLTAPLPSGDIAAFGVYSVGTASDKLFVDNYEVDAAPEPTGVAGLIGVGLLLRRRRR